MFGNDVVFKYLCALDLPHLVRSHQCVLKGFETTTLPNNYEHHTVFSASNYCGSQNLAAVLIFNATQKEEREDRTKAGKTRTSDQTQGGKEGKNKEEKGRNAGKPKWKCEVSRNGKEAKGTGMKEEARKKERNAEIPKGQ